MRYQSKQANDGARVTCDNSLSGSTFTLVSCANLQPDSSYEQSTVNTTNTVASNCESTVNQMRLAKETSWTEDNQDHVKPSCDDGLVRCQDGTQGPSDDIYRKVGGPI